MAKSISHKITTTDKLTIKGLLSEEATIITIVEGEKDNMKEVEKKISDYLKLFDGKGVEITITEKSEEDVE
jgi:hypothetical protein